MGKIRKHPESFVGNGVEIGECTYITKGCEIGHGAIIGRWCAIAMGLLVITGNHRTDTLIMSVGMARRIGGEEVGGARKKMVKIGDGCWTGRNATIVPNVHIGEGAVIGAGSVVTKDVPPYAIVAGNPARLIRYRIPEQLIPRVLDLHLYDRPLEEMKLIARELTTELTEESLLRIEEEFGKDNKNNIQENCPILGKCN